jgi:hypothetical protein
MRAAIRDAAYPEWSGCLCCGRLDARNLVASVASCHYR